MNNQEVARRAKLYGAASAWSQVGMSIIPLEGKKPAVLPGGSNGAKRVNWRNHMKRKAGSEELKKWYKLGMLENIGIICGRISDNLVVIDLDGEDAVQRFESRWGCILDTYTILTGSGKGKHLYYYVYDLPPSRRHDGVEIRADGCYVVAPPSIHPDTGNPYSVIKNLPILQLRTMFPVVEWLDRQAGRLNRQPPKQVDVKLPTSGYGSSALRGELARLRAAPDGNRNNQLNISAFRLGQLVADDLLTQYEVESALLSEALAIGLSEKESAATIKSGLNAGIRKPRGRRA